MNLRRKLTTLRKHLRTFGWRKTVLLALDRVLNAVMFVDCLHIVLLDRAKVSAPKVVDEEPLTFRLATAADLHAMLKRPELDVGEDKVLGFIEGDSCLLHYVGDELAGYAWAHTRGMPLIIPGLRLKTPPAYLYNYASLTLPKFRGRNHQALRHHELLERPEWKGCAGLIGYVRHTNWSSRNGLRKSGYVDIGRIWLFGTRDHFRVWIPRHLRNLGIARVPVDLQAPAPGIQPSPAKAPATKHEAA